MSKGDNTTNRVKFTIGKVRGFVCPKNKKEALLWDTEVKTLCIRARLSGSRSYYFQSRLNGKVIKINLGSVGDSDNINSGFTFDEARQLASEYQTLVKSGRDPRLKIKQSIQNDDKARVEQAKREVRFSQVVEDYIDANSDDWGESHLNDYKKCLGSTERGRDGILSAFKDAKLEALTSAMLLKWIKAEKIHRPTSVAKGYRLLRGCLNWADGQNKYKGIVELDQLFHNTEIKKALPKPKAKSDSLQREQLPIWFDAVKGINNQVIAVCLQTLLLTGARREEITTLKWKDIDFTWLSMRIKDKVEGERIIPLTPYVATLLQGLPKRNKWVFSSPTAESGRLQDPYHKHTDAIALADLPHISLHGLRRSFSSLSEWVECPLGVVAQIQGHKPSATAEKHYKVRPLDLLRVWHTKIEKEILGFAGIEQPEEVEEGLRAVK